MSTPMDEILKSLREDRLFHPVVVVLGCRQDISQIFVAIENKALPMTFGVISAVEWLLKPHFVLNMEYVSKSRHILHFLQCTVFDIQDALPLSHSGSDLSLHIHNKRCRV